MTLNLHRRFMFLLTLLTGLVVSGCGSGGGDVGGVDSGGTGSFASGTIAGFGSIIVNDIRYDDRQAVVADAYGNQRSRQDLRLGMVVEIEGSALVTAPAGALHRREGIARVIRLGAEIRGPLQSVDAGNSRLVVLGQSLEITPATIFGDELVGGLAAMVPQRRDEVLALGVRTLVSGTLATLVTGATVGLLLG